VKLMADAKGGKITHWIATDEKGKPLPIKTQKQESGSPSGPTQCKICVQILRGPVTVSICYVYDCSKK
jgi:hypothetical protein